MSDATKMADELLSLVQGTIPKTREWQTEIHLELGSLPASRNKFLVCNAADLVFAWLRNDRDRVRQILDWWVGFAATPFTAGEELTGEEVYRPMQAYSALTAAAVATKADHFAAENAALRLARAHAAWLLLGAGCGPAKRVRDHHLDKVGKPVVLIGDGAPVSDLPYIAQAGMRGWIRSREKNQPQTFLFCESIGLSLIVGQAADLAVPRKLAPWQSDLFAALRRLAPTLPAWGLSPDDQAAARAYLRNPTDPVLARRVVDWIGQQVPPLPFTFVRYADGSIVTLFEDSHSSSTDARMIDAWYADGRSMKTSADDGLRSASPPQRGFELGDAFACQLESGGTVMTLPRPRTAEAWRLRTSAGTVTLTVPGIAQPAPAPPPSAPPATPTPPSPPQRQRRRRWWEFWR